jgi:hypothetical protein
MKKLTELEFERLEKNRAILNGIEGEVKLEKQRLSEVDLRQKILELMIANLNVERLGLSKNITGLNERKMREKSHHEEVLAKIKKRLKIKGAFGYNPDTLEVILNDS